MIDNQRVSMVGGTGIEPVTPTMSRQCPPRKPAGTLGSSWAMPEHEDGTSGEQKASVRQVSAKPRLCRYRGAFAVYYYADGVRHRLSLGTTDRAVAEQKLREWKPPTKTRQAIGDRVYFIHMECPEGFIKIGVATSARDRLAGLQAASPYRLTLLGHIDGGEAREAELHARFAYAHVRGEWFRPVDELLAFIQAIPRQPDPMDFYGYGYPFPEELPLPPQKQGDRR